MDIHMEGYKYKGLGEHWVGAGIKHAHTHRDWQKKVDLEFWNNWLDYPNHPLSTEDFDFQVFKHNLPLIN